MATEINKVEQFMVLFTAHQRRLYHYILALLPNPGDAEDVLQETNLVLWRKFDQYETGTNFLAWAMRVAYLQVLKTRESKGRQALLLDSDVLEQLALDAEKQAPRLEEQNAALRHCLKKLRPVDHRLITLRYQPGSSGKTLAQTLNRPVNSVYKSLGRIRRALMECIRRRLAAQVRCGDMA